MKRGMILKLMIVVAVAFAVLGQVAAAPCSDIHQSLEVLPLPHVPSGEVRVYIKRRKKNKKLKHPTTPSSTKLNTTQISTSGYSFDMGLGRGHTGAIHAKYLVGHSLAHDPYGVGR